MLVCMAKKPHAGGWGVREATNAPKSPGASTYRTRALARGSHTRGNQRKGLTRKGNNSKGAISREGKEVIFH